MITKTVTYTDFDGNKQTRELHFHLSKSVLAENIDIKDEFEQVMTDITATEEGSDMPPELIRRLFGLLKRITLMAYGVRKGADEFEQNAEVQRQFANSPAFDEFLWRLMSDKQAMDFIVGLLPTDLREQAEQQLKADPNGPTAIDEDRESKAAALRAQLEQLENN